MKKVYYYKNYTDDLIVSKNQHYKLKKDYKWINNNIFYKICSWLIYYFAYVISWFYCKFFLHVKIENRKILDEYKNQGYFLYGNHTQPIGDVFIPVHVCKNKRIYTIASTANLGIPVIGKILPMLGALPIPETVKDTEKLYEAIQKRIEEEKCIVIYPEAHVWEYYTKIRPFPATSFKFPIKCNTPSFVITTTYYKRKFGKKPEIKVYVDGPFTVNQELNKREQQENLKNQIYQCMENRSKNSTYEYMEYKKG